MTLSAPLALRWERAQQIDPASIQELGNNLYFVLSKGGPAGYAVQIDFDPQGKLVFASCTCPDFQKRLPGPNTANLRGVRVCKHILAASIKAKETRLQRARGEAGAAIRPFSPPFTHQEVTR